MKSNSSFVPQVCKLSGRVILTSSCLSVRSRMHFTCFSNLLVLTWFMCFVLIMSVKKNKNNKDKKLLLNSWLCIPVSVSHPQWSTSGFFSIYGHFALCEVKNVALRIRSADPEMPSSQITVWFHSSWQEARRLKRWLAEEKWTCWTEAFSFIRCLFHIAFQSYPRRDDSKHIEPWTRSPTLSWSDVSQIIHQQSDVSDVFSWFHHLR